MMILPSGDVTLSAWIQASALTVATFDHALESLTTPSLVVCSNTALPKRAVPALAPCVASVVYSPFRPLPELSFAVTPAVSSKRQYASGPSARTMVE